MQDNAEVRTCPNCLRDFGDEQVTYVWSSIFKAEICEYCWLEIGLEFQEGFGDHYTQMAVKQSGLDLWTIRRCYLQDIIQKIKFLLDGDLTSEMREHREWNLKQCEDQISAINAYQQAMLTIGNKNNQNEATRRLGLATETHAFGIDLIRNGCNYITD